MKVTGAATLHAPAGEVWAALNDPALLVQAIPGCQRLTLTAPDTYELALTAGVGTITGTYTGQISLTDAQPPHALTLRASGAGTPGTVATTVLIQLADNSNETLLTYDADATVSGLIAGVGQRLLAGVAKRQATQFFTTLDQLLTTSAITARPAGPAAAGAAGEVPGRYTAGAAGVASPAEPATQDASGMTWEPPTALGQPAGRRGAGLQSAGRRGAGLQSAGRTRARLPGESFLQGAIAGAAIALAGVVVGSLINRRKH